MLSCLELNYYSMFAQALQITLKSNISINASANATRDMPWLVY